MGFRAAQEERIEMLKVALIKKGINVGSGHYYEVARPVPVQPAVQEEDEGAGIHL